MQKLASYRAPANHCLGHELNQQYQSVRTEFPKLYDRWNASGQNNPGFETSLPVKNRTNEVTAINRNMQMFFKVLRKGQDDVLKDLLDFIIRTKPTSSNVW